MASRWIPRIPALSAGGGGPPPQIQDHFAPKYIVGNVLAGDPAIAQAAPFVYVPDPGDGSGIALALTQFAGPGDVWIRPGTYNFGLGAVVTPLAIPAGVRVQGAGQTTILLARVAGDQGVFTLGALASLRDLAIAAAASPTGVGSTALVTVAGGATLRDLSLQIGTDLAGTLRETVRFLTPPGFLDRPSDVLNVRVTMTNGTGVGSPTRGFYLEPNSFVFARDNVITGGDIGIDSDSGIYVAHSAAITNSDLFGVRHTGTSGGGAIRIDEAVILVTGAGAVGVQLGIGGHVLRSVSVQHGLGTGSIAVNVVEPNNQVSSVQLDDMQVNGFETAYQLGSAAVSASVSDITIADSVSFTSRNGIVIDDSSSVACHLKGNTVQVFLPGGGPAGQSIFVRGSRHEIEGNHLDHSNPDVNGDAVLIEADRTAFIGNTLSFQDLVGVRVTGTRPVVTSNEITASGNQAQHCVYFARQGAQYGTLGDNTIFQNIGGNATEPVRIDSNLNTIGNNSIEKALVVPSVAGILIAGNNNACIGNVVENAPGGAVTDTGTGNEIAHNVGV